MHELMRETKGVLETSHPNVNLAIVAPTARLGRATPEITNGTTTIRVGNTVAAARTRAGLELDDRVGCPVINDERNRSQRHLAVRNVGNSVIHGRKKTLDRGHLRDGRCPAAGGVYEIDREVDLVERD